MYTHDYEFEEEDEEENKEEKQRLNKEQLEKLHDFNLSNYDTMKEEYDTYSPKKKIEILLAKCDVFGLELDATKKIYNFKKRNDLEKKVLQYQQNFLKNKIWLSEKEISDLLDYIPENDSLRNKIKASNVTIRTFEVPPLKTNFTTEEIQALPPQDRIKALLTYCSLFYLELNAIEKKKLKSLKSRKSNEYELAYLKRYCKHSLTKKIIDDKCNIDYKELARLYREELPDDYLILEHRSNDIMNLIKINHNNIISIYNKLVPKNYPYRKELLEDMQNETIPGSNYQIMHKESLDERTRKVYRHTYYEITNGFFDYVYNLEVLEKKYNEYSPKKKVEVGLAFHYLFISLIKGTNKWRTSRDMDEFEKILSEERYNAFQCHLRYWDQLIIVVAVVEVEFSAPYYNEIWQQIEEANINKSCILKEIAEANVNYSQVTIKLQPISRSDLTIEFMSRKLSPEDKIRYLIALRNLESAECDMLIKDYKSREIGRYEKIIFKSYCSYQTKSVVTNDDAIFCIFYEELPADSPYKLELREKMKKANISNRGYSAKKFRDMPLYKY